MSTTGDGMATLVRRVEAAAYDLHAVRTSRLRVVSPAAAERRWIAATRELGAAIGPDRRGRRELAARSLPRGWKPSSGDTLAYLLASSAVDFAAHARRHGDTPRPGDPRCAHDEWCGGGSPLWMRRREVMGRAVTPGRTVARIVLSATYDLHRWQAHVQAFYADGCGGPERGDWLDGGHPQARRQITPADVEARMAATGQPWRLVTRDRAAAALVDAGYRICRYPDHTHAFSPADAGPDVWRRADVDDWHVEHGTQVAYVVRTEPEE